MGVGGSLNPDALIREATSSQLGAVRNTPGASLPLGEKEDTAPLSLQPVEKNKL